DLSVEELHQRLFTPTKELPEGVKRLPLKMVHLNKSPVVVPMNTLTPEAAARWQIDVAVGRQHAEKLQQAAAFEEKVRQAHTLQQFAPVTDPDQDLYGGFFNDQDRKQIDIVRNTKAENLAGLQLAFKDKRLPEMLFRYQARNWPETLSGDDQARWSEFRRKRICESDGGGSINLTEYRERITELKDTPDIPAEKKALLDDLMKWGDQIESSLQSTFPGQQQHS
ncbi:exodeoxyribonuclease I, partial [Pseudomonadota bacterium]